MGQLLLLGQQLLAGGQPLLAGFRSGARSTTDPGTLLAVAYDWRGLQAAIDAAEIAIDGDREVVERFLGLFALPAPYWPAG